MYSVKGMDDLNNTVKAALLAAIEATEEAIRWKATDI